MCDRPWLVGKQRESGRPHIHIVGRQILLIKRREIIAHAERIPLGHEFQETITIVLTTVIRIEGAVAHDYEYVPSRICRWRRTRKPNSTFLTVRRRIPRDRLLQSRSIVADNPSVIGSLVVVGSKS